MLKLVFGLLLSTLVPLAGQSVANIKEFDPTDKREGLHRSWSPEGYKSLRRGRTIQWISKRDGFSPELGYGLIEVRAHEKAVVPSSLLEALKTTLSPRAIPTSKQRLELVVVQANSNPTALDSGQVIVPWFVIEGRVVGEDGTERARFLDKQLCPIGTTADWTAPVYFFCQALLSDIFEGRIGSI